MSSEAGSLMPSPFRYHSLATRTYSLSTGRQTFLRLDDDRAVHPVRDVRQHGLRAAVVHEDARVARLEAEGEGLARRDVLESLVRRDPRRVEVDRVRDRATVRERHLDRLALANVHDRAGGAVAVEGPGVVLDTGSDLDRDVLQGHVHLDEVAGSAAAAASRRKACARRRARPRSRERRRRSCSAAARRCARCAGRGASARSCGVARLAGIRPHQQREEAENGNQDAEQQCGNLGEHARLGLDRRGSGDALGEAMTVSPP